MKLMITGSRSLSKNEEATRDVNETLDALLAKHADIQLLSGGARGIDKMAEAWAKERKVPVVLYLPDYKRFKRGAPLVRNQEMVDTCDGVVAFWDGKSKGTKFVLDRARGKLLSCSTYEF